MAPGGRLIDLGDVYFLLRRQEDRPDERNKDYGRNDQETGETNPVAGHELERRTEPGQDPTEHRVSETAFARRRGHQSLPATRMRGSSLEESRSASKFATMTIVVMIRNTPCMTG